MGFEKKQVKQSLLGYRATEDFIKKVDKVAKKKGFANRSSYIRDVMERNIKANLK